MTFERTKCEKENVDLQDEGQSINKYHHIKFLGMMIDATFNGKNHVSYTCTITKGIGILIQARHYLDKDTLLSLYPKLTYSNILWSGTFKCNLDKLYLLQKKVVRIISRVNWRYHN